jgi:hypothetical protein
VSRPPILWTGCSTVTLPVREGRAVWPVRSSDDRAALCRVVELFGGVLEEVSMPGEGGAGGEETVRAWGGAVEAGQLYAHLTGRHFEPVAGLPEALVEPPPAVMVLEYDALCPELLNWASDPERPVTGLVCASSREDLRRQVLVRAAAAQLCEPVKLRRAEVMTYPSPYVPFPVERGGVERLGPEVPPHQIAAALGAGAGVLQLSHHSDGLDGSLGEGLTLCPMDRPPATADPGRPPRCWVTGKCIRQQRPVEEARAEGRLLPPEAIAARVLVWDACRALMLPHGQLDARWALAERLLSSGNIGAVIMPWEAIIANPAVERLCADLAEGTPAGEALPRFLRAPLSRRLGHRMCLFGDPRLRAAPPPTRPGARPRRNETNVAVEESHAQLEECGLLRACLQNGAMEKDEARRAAAAEAVTALRHYEERVWTGHPLEGSPEAPGPQMRGKALAHLMRGPELPIWTAYAFCDGVDSASTRRCGTCGARLKCWRYRLRIPGVGPRRVSTCGRCALAEDAPWGSDLTLRVDDRRVVVLEGTLPSGRASAGLVVEDFRQIRRPSWPLGADGSPVRTFELPSGAPTLPTRLGLFLIDGCRLTLLVAHVRGSGGPIARAASSPNRSA